MKLNLIVIRSKDIQVSKSFYENVFGFIFKSEKHGTGPTHYSTDLEGVIFEIYPANGVKTEGLRIGFQVECFSKIKNQLHEGNTIFKENTDSLLIVDPDGHKIEIIKKT